MKYDNEEDYCFLVNLFEETNRVFLKNDNELFYWNVSERTLCGALKRRLENKKWRTRISNYIVDVEFNRNAGEIKTIVDRDLKIVSITCDLILHSRGKIKEQDNLIALEMKKSDRNLEDKSKDRDRLIALTKSSYNDVWSTDGKTLPEHVCRYILGIYYEIDLARQIILLEYYRKGKLVSSKEMEFNSTKIHR